MTLPFIEQLFAKSPNIYVSNACCYSAWKMGVSSQLSPRKSLSIKLCKNLDGNKEIREVQVAGEVFGPAPSPPTQGLATSAVRETEQIGLGLQAACISLQTHTTS